MKVIPRLVIDNTGDSSVLLTKRNKEVPMAILNRDDAQLLYRRLGELLKCKCSLISGPSCNMAQIEEPK